VQTPKVHEKSWNIPACGIVQKIFA